MLRRIILENFMSHGRTEIDLAEGLTVLTGPNNCGKSAVVAALQILATNGRSKHVLRHGEKFARVTVETDDGHTICWERSKTTVKYTIDGEDIHRVGSSVPDSLHDLLRLDRVETDAGKAKHEYDIHFGEQKSPIFLLGETGSRAASFFASSSDASRLVEMQHLHRVKLREQRSAAKRLNTKSGANTARLKLFEPIDSIADRVSAADSVQQAIAGSEKHIEQLKVLIRRLNEQSVLSERLQETCRTLDRLDDTNTNPATLQQTSESSARLGSLATRLFDCESRLGRLSRVSGVLNSLVPVPRLHGVSRLQALIENLASGGVRKRSANAIVNGCSELTPPPDLQPAIACRGVWRQIVAATEKQLTIDRTRRRLAPLLPVPVLSNTSRLSSLVDNLVDVGRKQNGLRSAQTAFAPLTQPPEHILTPRIRKLMLELDSRNGSVAQLKAKVDSLLALKPPAAEIDLKELTNSLAQLDGSHATVEQTQKNLEVAKQQVSDCEMQIRQFVKTNPKCETCGASIDPEALMTSSPSIHVHSPDAVSDTVHAKKGKRL